MFTSGPLNATNVVSCTGQTVPLPPGNYSRLQDAGAGVQGNQTAQSFVVTYTEATTRTFTESLSDWYSPQNYAGELQAIPMSYRNSSDDTADNRTFYLYGYSFALKSAKTIQSVRLPNAPNAIVTAVSLVPNWPPTFGVNPFGFHRRWMACN